MSRRRICVVTGTRAEYGLLYWVMREIAAEPTLELQIVATGMHLSPEFGLTHRVIESDGFTIDAKVEMLLSGDTPVAIAKSTGLATIGFADAFERLRPDIVMVLGDRFELLAAAQAALFARIPIAHIAGGDVTEGAYDEAIRHSITKMSQLHFATNADAVRRLRQLGEDPRYVFHVGSPGLDHVHRTPRLGREELSRSLDFSFRARNALVTFHPATLDAAPAASQFEALLLALERLGPDFGLIITKPNSDGDGRVLFRMIDEFVVSHPNARAYVSIGQQRYLSTIAEVDVVVGNSSSGLYEVPSFGKPTVNVGDRQRGRLRASSVIDCDPDPTAIEAAIRRALAMDCSGAVNPYGDGHSAPRIVKILREVPDPRALVKKSFHDLPELH